MNVTRITPVLIVESIEPALPFWEDHLGYSRATEVPHEGHLGFLLLVRGETQVMLQSRASIAADLPALGGRTLTSVLFVDVDSIEGALANAGASGSRLLAGPRETFYGTREVWVEDPAGQVIGFSMPAAR